MYSKPFLKILCLYFLIVGFISCSKQTHVQHNKELIETIENEIEGINQIIKLSNMQLRIEPSNAYAFDSTDNFNFSSKSEFAIPELSTIETFLDSLVPLQTHITPHLYVEFKDSKIRRSDLIEYSLIETSKFKIQVEALSYTINNTDFKVEEEDYINYKNLLEKREISNEDFEWNDYELELITSNNDLDFMLLNTMPIDAIKVKYIVQYYEPDIYTIDANNPITSEQRGVELIQLKDNIATIRFPLSLEDAISIDGLYKDGRQLSLRSYSGSTISSTEKLVVLKEALEESKHKVMANQITSLDSLKAYLDLKLENENFDEEQMYEKEIKFTGPVSALRVKINKTEPQILDFIKTYNFHLNQPNRKKQNWVSKDVKTDLYGILNKEGEWIIEPTFEEPLYSNFDNFYFEGSPYTGFQDYFLDEANKVLKKVNYYVLDNTEIFDKHYIIVRDRDELKGIVDIKNGEYVVSPWFYDIKYYKNGKWKFKNVREYDFYVNTIDEIVNREGPPPPPGQGHLMDVENSTNPPVPTRATKSY